MSKETDRLQQQVEELQDDLKVLKNEIKETLTDIREHLLTGAENPFPVDLTPRALGTQNNVPMTNGHLTQPSAPESAAPAALLESAPPAATPWQAAVTNPPVANQPVDLAALLNASLVTSMFPGNPAQTIAPSGLQTAPAFPPATPPPPQGNERAEASLPGLPPASGESEVEAMEEAGPSVERIEEPASNNHYSESQPMAQEISVTEKETRNNGSNRNGAMKKGAMPDLTSLSLLAPWVEEGVRKVGRDRLRSIVDMYASMNGLSPDLKQTILHLIDLEEGEGPAGKVSLKKCLRILADLDNLVWRSQFDHAGTALLNVYLSGGR